MKSWYNESCVREGYTGWRAVKGMLFMIEGNEGNGTEDGG